MQAGTVVQQVSLGDIAAHAVAEQEQRCARVVLANVLGQPAEVVDHGIPAMMAAEQAQAAVLGATPVATLVSGEHGKASRGQGQAQALVAPGMLGHAMGQQDYGFHWRGWQPLVHVQAAVLADGQPEGVVGHGGSLCAWGTGTVYAQPARLQEGHK